MYYYILLPIHRREAAIDVDRHGSLRLSSPGDITLLPAAGAGFVLFDKKVTSWEDFAEKLRNQEPRKPEQAPAATNDNTTDILEHLQRKLHQLEKRLQILEDGAGSGIVSSWMAPVFFQMMTPEWLRSHATFYETPVITAEQVAFIPAEVRYHRLLSVPLVSAGQLSADKTYLISMTIRHTKMNQHVADNDLMLAISDEKSAIGFWFMDQQPFVTLAGVPGVVLTKITRSIPDLEPPSSSAASPEIWHMRMRLTAQSSWGTVWGPSLSAGQGRQSVYPRLLKPSGGLSLELYRNDPNEAYLIKYIEVTISAEQ
eukprot:scpid83428/ scgid9249/ 